MQMYLESGVQCKGNQRSGSAISDRTYLLAGLLEENNDD